MEILIEKYQRRRLTETGGVKNIEGMAEVDDLKRKVEGLSLACQAFFEILQSHIGLTESAILQKMQEIDERDGKLDGKTAAPVLECIECGRKSNASRTTCVYCGAPLPAVA